MLLALMLWLGAGVGAGVAMAQTVTIDGSVKLRLSCEAEEGSSVAPGSSHGVNSPVCWTYTDAYNADCYWYLKEVNSGQYSIQNASTGEYMTWDGVRSGSAGDTSTPVRRYLTLTTTLKGDSSLWVVNRYDDNEFYIACVLNEQFLDARLDESYALGTFNRTERVPTYNERFFLIQEDGTYYTASGSGGDDKKDSTATSGITADGLYWSSQNVSTPFVVTTDYTNPVYYYVKNLRSDNWLTPTVGGYLSQSASKPAQRFYFVESDKGYQIMVEGDGYVSGGMPSDGMWQYDWSTRQRTYVVESSGTEVSVKSGSPADGDELWTFTYQSRGTYSGYAIKMESSSLNTTSNLGYYQYYSKNGYYYLNDYSGGGEGICWWLAEDDGSTFVFYSADTRHRDLLISEGVTFNDTIHGGDDTPDITDQNGYILLESIKGDVNYVYLASGEVVGVPQMYVDSIQQTRDSIIVHTAADSTASIPSFAYARYEVDSISTVAPRMPVFNSYKFNDKFNRFIIEDAQGEVSGDSLVTLTVKGIGKTLRPSFKLDDDVQAFIGDSLQQSKVTRVRFAKDVKYTVARRGHTILRRTALGRFRIMPLGNEITVRVDFLTDHPTSEYKVPTIYLTTQGSSAITSKTTYLSGTVRIDGAGVFPDLAQTDMQIKGRGNSSWTTTGKAPYHLKFATSTSVLGLKKGKHWNLIANAQSRSATTNAIAMKMAQLVETAGYNHEIPVELYLNGVYRGSYNLTENIGFRNNSIDLDDETYATMLELDTYYDDDYKFTTSNYSLPVNIKEPDLADSTITLNFTQIRTHFNRAITALYNKEDMTQHFDMDYLARYLFVEDLSMNFEFHHPKSTFLYNPNIQDTDSRYIFGPVWDFDWGFGYQDTHNYFTVSATRYFWNGPSSSRMEATRWVGDLRYCSDDLNRAYYRLWKQFMEDGSLQELIDFSQDYYDYAALSLTHNNTMWGGGNADTYSTVTTNSKSWLQKRASYIYNYLGNTLGYEALGYGQDTTSVILQGDVNGDGAITTADLVCVLNYILGLPNEEFDFNQADMDANDIITVADLIRVRNLIAQQQSRSSRFYSLPQAGAAIQTGSVAYTEAGISMPLIINVGEGRYSGVQFDLKIPAGMTVEDLDIQSAIPDFQLNIAEVENGSGADDAFQRYRVSIYSGADHLLPQGKSALTLNLGWGDADRAQDVLTATIANVLFATAEGEDEQSVSRSVSFVGNQISGLNSAVAVVGQNGGTLTLQSGGDAVVPVYGVDGRLYRVLRLSSGIQNVSLPQGVYIINKQKIVVR